MTAARRALAAVLLAAAVTVTAAACTPAAPPTHFGSCPPRQHWSDPSGSSFGWRCTR